MSIADGVLQPLHQRRFIGNIQPLVDKIIVFRGITAGYIPLPLMVDGNFLVGDIKVMMKQLFRIFVDRCIPSRIDMVKMLVDVDDVPGMGDQNRAIGHE